MKDKDYNSLKQSYIDNMKATNKYKFYAILGWSLLIFFAAASIILGFI